MPWILAIVLVVAVVALTRTFVINARTIMRDMNGRFDRLQVQLEDRANSVVDDLFNADPPHDIQPGRRGGEPDRA